VYRSVDDTTEEGIQARLRFHLLRLARMCLAQAMSLEEDTDPRNITVGSVLYITTSGFLKGRLVIRAKEITREQVQIAMLSWLRYLVSHPEDEAAELIILVQDLLTFPGIRSSHIE
jgi:hypothetical protein